MLKMEGFVAVEKTLRNEDFLSSGHLHLPQRCAGATCVNNLDSHGPDATLSNLKVRYHNKLAGS